MASLGHIDYSVLKGTTQDDVNASTAKEIAALKASLAKKVDKTGFQKWYRALQPEHLGAVKIDFNTLEFGEYLIRGFGDGSTHAPPIGKASYFFLEVIFMNDSKVLDTLQRAWAFHTGELFTRSRVAGKWSDWVSSSKPLPEPVPEPVPEV